MQIKQSITHLTPVRHTAYTCLIILVILQCSPANAISIVYNFRVAQITKQPIFGKEPIITHSVNHKIVALMFDQYHKKYLGTHRNFAGSFGSFIYDFGLNYFRIDGAFSHVKEVTNQTTFSGTTTDDILFSFGRGFPLTDRTEINFSGLFGIPTHKVNELRHADFGFGLVGSGIQVDGSYRLNERSTLIYGGRYLHFFPRKATDIVNQSHTFTIGNIADFLCSCDISWNRHGVELGYSLRSLFGGKINPEFANPSFNEIIRKTNYISSFYAVYKYTFLINDIPNRLLFNIAYSIDHRPKLYLTKDVIMAWIAWGIAF